MDNKLIEINNILHLVDRMIEYIQRNSIIRPGNNEYISYKQALSDFCRKYDVKAQYPAAYNLLGFYYYESSSYSTVKRALNDLKRSGYLTVQQRHRKSGANSTLLYTVKDFKKYINTKG